MAYILGEEYSCIAVLNGKDVEVIENNENQKLTPCAIWISEKKRLYTGLYAKIAFLKIRKTPIQDGDQALAGQI